VTTAVQRPPQARPTTAAERALAPDLARGLMLLLIALAHVPWFLYRTDLGFAIMHPDGGGVADRIAQVFNLVVVDGRANAMFAFLLAYGIGQMYARQRARGTSERAVRRLFRRRHIGLLVIGVLHGVLLFQAEILAGYGIMGLVLVPLFLTRSDKVLKIWAVVLAAVGALFYLGSTALTLGTPLLPVGPSVQHAAIAEPSYLQSLLMRAELFAPAPFLNLLTVVQPLAFMLGLLASRHRVLEEPGRHLRLLRWTAAVGIGIGWVSGALFALGHLGLLPVPNPAALGSMQIYTGVFAGIGYAAVFGLVAHHLSGRRLRLPTQALVALGRRSMSGYLAQSVLFIPLLSGWGLAVGAHLSSWSVALVGVGTWLVTVIAAYLMEQRGVRGPAEVLLRRFTYR
jgi:uncharacterized protein